MQIRYARKISDGTTFTKWSLENKADRMVSCEASATGL